MDRRELPPREKKALEGMVAVLDNHLLSWAKLMGLTNAPHTE
jgi:hypothetical protein